MTTRNITAALASALLAGAIGWVGVHESDHDDGETDQSFILHRGMSIARPGTKGVTPDAPSLRRRGAGAFVQTRAFGCRPVKRNPPKRNGGRHLGRIGASGGRQSTSIVLMKAGVSSRCAGGE